MTPEFFFVCVLAGVLSLDQNAGPKLQFYQPLCSASLAGALLGDFETGLWVGGVLQCIYATLQPVGGARLPDVASAGIAAALSLPVATTGSWWRETHLAAPCVVGVLFAYMGGWMLALQRKFQEKRNQRVVALLASHREIRLTGEFRLGLGLHFLRGALLAALAWFSAPWLSRLLMGWGLQMAVAPLALALALAAFVERQGLRWRPTMAGAALGLALWWGR